MTKERRDRTYSPAIAIEVCNLVASGGNIITILQSDDRYPSWPKWRDWIDEQPELAIMYARSKQAKAEAVDKQIDDIMHELHTGLIDPATARVMIDTLKWKAAKYYPKMFGDKLDLTSAGDKIGNEIKVTVHKPKD